MRKYLFPFLLLLAGCASLGLAPASTIKDRIAYAYSTESAVVKAARDSLAANEITSADAENVVAIASQADQALDLATTAVGAGDLSTAEARLQLAVSLLTNLQTRLRAAGAKP